MSTISELMVKIGADSSGLSSSLNTAKQDIDKTFAVNPVNEMNTAINNLNGSVSGMIGKFNNLVGLAATGFGLSSLIQGAVNAGAGVYQMSQTMHASTAEAAEFNRILKLTGVETHTAETAFVRLDKTLTSSGEEGDKCRAVFKAVGISMTDQNGKLLPINQQLGKLADGYQKAASAGMGQEFVMNTLGVRGMELVKTLKNYNQAKENGAKVQGIGLNPEEMYKMQQQLHLLEMQAGQLKLVFGSVFVNLLGGNVEHISSGLATIAKDIADNRQQITATTGEVFKLLAAYEAVKVAGKIGNGISGAWQSMSTKSEMNAINEAQEAALTIQQERSISKRQNMIDAAAKKEEAAYYKTVQAMEVSEAEKTQIFNEYLIKREQASLESQAAIRTSMTEMYLQTNIAAEESATAQAASMNTVAIAAEETAARVMAANTAEAAESAVVIAAEEGKAAAMTEAGIAGTTAANTTAAANAELTEAEILAGSAAAEAGQKAVASNGLATVAVGENIVANKTLAVAETAAGNEAVITGEKTVAACEGATIATKGLSVAAGFLRNQWLLVAFAIYEACSALQSYYKSKAQEKESNDGVDYQVDGKHYAMKNGDFYEVEETTNVRTDREGFEHPYTYRSGLSSEAVERGSDVHSQLENQYNDAHANDDDVIAASKAAENAAAAKKQQDDLMAALQEKNKEKKPKHEEKPKSYEVQTAVGEVASSIAAAHPEGEQWMGNITDDSAIQCDSFTANVYNQAGIGSIGGYDTSRNVINDAAFKAANAYHPVGDGYQAQNGDMVDFAGHVGIYQDGNVISRQSSGGVHTASMSEAEAYFGSVKGYGSISDATGNMTITQTVDEAGKKIEEAAQKLVKAKDEAYKLFQSMSNTILNETDTTYQQGINKINQDVTQKQQEINKLGVAGVDVTALKQELDIYKKTLEEKVVKVWHDAWFKIKDDTQKSLDDILGDYEDEAQMQYNATLRSLDEEKKERLKAIAQSGNDYTARLAVDKWYNAQVLKAANDRDKALSEAHSKMIKQWESEGDYNKILSSLSKHPEQEKQDVDTTGQQKLASEVVKIWDVAHQSIDANIASVADDLYGSLTTSMEGFISGTKSAMDIVHSFGNAIISEIERIAAQQLAGQFISGLLGNYIGTQSSGVNGAVFDQYLPSTSFSTGSYSFENTMSTTAHPFAKGGIVTAPTLGLIGEAGQDEAIIPLNSENLSAIGGKGSSGGVVVNITNKSDSTPQVTNTKYDASINKTILDIVIDGASRNVSGFGTNLKTVLGQ